MAKEIKNSHLVNVYETKGLIHITFGEDYLQHTVENCEDLEGLNTTTGEMVPAKVVNLKSLKKDFIRALLLETEDGTNLVHGLIDLASKNAIDLGCEGVEIYDEP